MRAFISPVLAFSLSVRDFRKLFASFGEELPVPDSASRLVLAEALWGIRVSSPLFAALDDLAQFVTPTGLFAVTEALLDTGLVIAPKLRPASRAAALLRLRSKRKSIARVLERIRLRIERFPPLQSASERIAYSPRAIESKGAALLRFRDALGGDAGALLFGEDDDGGCHIAIARPLPKELRTTVREGALTTRTVRPVAIDILRIDARQERLSVETLDPMRVQLYKEKVGEAFFSDRSYFADSPAFTLKPLTRLGLSGLAALPLPKGVTRVRIVELEWSDGEYAYFTAKGSNALAVYEMRGGPSAGYIAAAVLRIDLSGEGRPIDVAIRLPHHIGIREQRYASLVRKVLAAIGILKPGAIPDDVWTLSPWIHPEWRWRDVAGDDGYELLRAQGILELTETRLVAGEDARRFGWSYITFPLRGEPEKLYAVADDAALVSRSVSARDAFLARIDMDALAARLRRQLLLEAPPAGRGDGRFLDLGTRRGGDVAYHLVAVMRTPIPSDVPELLASIRRVSKGATSVVLLPSGRTLGGGIAEIGLSSRELLGVDSPLASVYGALAREFDAEGLVAPWQLAAPGVRLVLSAKSREAWFDGTLIVFGDTEWTLLFALAKAGSAGLETKVIEGRVFRNFSTGMARNVAMKIRDRVRSEWEKRGDATGGEPDAIVEFLPTRRWRIAVAFEVR